MEGGSRPRRGTLARFRGSSSGFALLATLFALLVLTGILHGTLAVARFHAFASRAEGRALAARVAAQSGVRSVAASILTDPSLFDGSGAPVRRSVAVGPETRVRVSIRRTASEWLWIEGEARVGSGTGEAVHRAGAAYWSLEPGVRAGALRATVEAGGGVATSSTTSIGPLEAGPDDPGYDVGACDRSAPAGSLLEAVSAPPVVELAEGGRTDSRESRLGAGLPTLGLLDGDALAARARAPDPTAEGSELRIVDGSFTVPAEGVRGVLAVFGDLEIPDDRSVMGLVLVGGSLTVRAGGRLVGGARVRGAVTVQGTSSIAGSRCTIIAVLEELPQLSRPLPAPDGTWTRIP